jgi:5-methylcytosine-specific restriction enzyme A
MDNLFTPFDIIWIKNVTNATLGHAYIGTKDSFVLHFPNQHRTNATSPKVGEIILLYQNINKQKVFTHLITPLDDIEVDDTTRVDYRYGRNVRVIATTPLSNLISVDSTLWDRVSFQGIGQGNACKIENITGIGNYDLLLQDIWEKFVPYFKGEFIKSVSQTNQLSDEIETSDPTLSVAEGRLRLIKHYARERNSEIVNRKKKDAIKADKLRCEICEFSFPKTYGVNFIECHHLTPLSLAGETKTTLDDLALVCPNCHRILHKLIDGKFLTIDELRVRIRTNAQQNVSAMVR